MQGMASRWGLGPVFAYEWLKASRRWQGYAGRAVFVAVLLLGLASVWVGQLGGESLVPIRAMAEIGRGFYNVIVVTQLTLVFLAAPAATAGSICQDKVSGTLAQMLLTDLSDAEIVLGKLAARLVPVLGLVCAALPVLALATLLGGVDPLHLTSVFLVTVGAAVFGCTLAMTFSIWGSKPYEVLLATYAFFAVWMLAIPALDRIQWSWPIVPVPSWMRVTHPYILALQPWEFGLIDGVVLSSGLVLISAGLVVLSVAKMRGVIVGQADAPASSGRSRGLLDVLRDALPFGFGRPPSLDGQPVLWYEVHRQRPSAWIRALIRLYFALAIVFTLIAIEDALRGGWWNRTRLPAFVVAFQVAMSLPLLLVAATTALVEERVRGSLDILMATPVSSRSIVLAKWWGVYRQVPRLVVLPAILAAVLIWVSGGWLAAGLLVLCILTNAAFWTSLGLALSTWIPRTGRAIATAAVLYALLGLGWPMLTQTVFHTNWRLGVGLTVGSPSHATFDLTCAIEQPRYFGPDFALFPIWIVVQAILALGLLLATLATFDRSIGRMGEPCAGRWDRAS
jgi:ABC-type transport system involved in multi-copper enzyme maturation permease subunit